MKKLTYIIVSALLVLMFTIPSYAFLDNNSGAESISDAESSSNSGASIIFNNPGETRDLTPKDDRNPIPGQTNLPMLPGYFGDNNRPGHQFIPLDKLNQYINNWNIVTVKKMLTGKRGGKTSNFIPLVDKVSKSLRSVSIITTKLGFDKKKFKIIQIGFGTVSATNKNCISADVFAKTLIEASLYGATHIQYLGEGTNTELESTGWGIGFNTTHLSGESTTTGGTGYSKGYAGYQNLPWIQYVALIVIPIADVTDADVDLEKDPIAQILENKLDPATDKAVKAGVVN